MFVFHQTGAINHYAAIVKPLAATSGQNNFLFLFCQSERVNKRKRTAAIVWKCSYLIYRTARLWPEVKNTDQTTLVKFIYRKIPSWCFFNWRSNEVSNRERIWGTQSWIQKTEMFNFIFHLKCAYVISYVVIIKGILLTCKWQGNHSVKILRAQ